DPPQEISRCGPNFIRERGAGLRSSTFVPSAALRRFARCQLGQYVQFCNRTFRVAPDDAKPLWPHPFEWLFFPFDRNSECRKAQPAGKSPTLADSLNRRHTGIAIEAIGVGKQRPKLFGRRFEIELPAIVEFAEHALGRDCQSEKLGSLA